MTEDQFISRYPLIDDFIRNEFEIAHDQIQSMN